jgi:hypothetical protein
MKFGSAPGANGRADNRLAKGALGHVVGRGRGKTARIAAIKCGMACLNIACKALIIG